MPDSGAIKSEQSRFGNCAGVQLKGEYNSKSDSGGAVKKKEKSVAPDDAQTKSSRSLQDQGAKLGIACTRESARLAATLGASSTSVIQFEANLDVASAGVLLALPALLANGLLEGVEKYFHLKEGYYRLQSLLLLLALAALLRIKTIERIRYCDPGELGKLIGLDRIPEVRTLREKITQLTETGKTQDWSQELAQRWMGNSPELCGTLYVDGHTRVYHGSQTKLPKRYVSRERLCLRGVVDYWVNDALGQPFFVISKTETAGLLTVLREEIIPNLETIIPGQPSVVELEKHPYLSRFGMVFDREGYSPKFFKDMWEKRISCYTYRKNVKDLWPVEEFQSRTMTFPNGEQVEMKLAERGVYFKDADIWLREIRKYNSPAHQTALITSDYSSTMECTATHLLCRWSQENFFKYMREHFEIDSLIGYQVCEEDDSITVVNPEYRQLDSQIRSWNSKLVRARNTFAELVMKEEIDGAKIQKFVQKKTACREEVLQIEETVKTLKEQKKEVDKHILFKELPPENQYQKFRGQKKQFLDVIKMIAYRAETALVSLLRESIHTNEEARGLVRQLFSMDADLDPNSDEDILTIKFHTLSTPNKNRIAEKLCALLNETETVFPGTNLRLVYKMGSA